LRTGLDTAGSDHFPIFSTIGGSFNTRNVFLYKLKINNKDLMRLSHTLHDNFANLESIISEDTLKAYQQMEYHIKNHLYYSFFPSDSRIPRSCASRKRPPPPPWWNKTCQIAVDERKDTTRKYLTCPSLANFIEYKRIRSNCSKVLKKQKRLG